MGQDPAERRRSELAPGSVVGNYKVVSTLGMGGMGIVYRARDVRLGRDVALKLLLSDGDMGPAALSRFEGEARAASALNHPNVVVVHELGRHEGMPYIVSELLEGETLRERLSGGPLPLWKALEAAKQVASGLAAAHERGIIHRDLKPENVFVTTDGVVKLLDFGLAKLHMSDHGHESTLVATQPGAVLGTVAYMAPEQTQGQELDARADLFSLGVILYECLTGKRPFTGTSSAAVMASILRDDPEDPQQLRPAIPPAVARIVRHSLEKRTSDRFQTARDLVFAIEALGLATRSDTVSGTDVRPAAPPPGPSRLWRVLPLVGAAAVAFAAGALVFRRKAPPPAPAPVVAAPAPPRLPEWRRLTYGKGQIVVARFASGDSFLFDRFTNLHSVRTYLARLDGRDARPILDDMAVLGVSRGGELAVLTGATFVADNAQPTYGTLARVPLIGGAPRPLLEHVLAADWAPDGERLAVLLIDGGRFQLQYPAGHPLYEAQYGLSHLRVSPSGKEVAFLEHPYPGDDRGQVAYVDAGGTLHRVTAELSSVWGLAWSPRGDELWFTASPGGVVRELRAVTLDGHERVLLRTPDVLTLHDVDASGRALVAVETRVRHVRALRPGAAHELEMGEYEGASVADLALDGKRMTYIDQTDPTLPEYRIYLRDTDGAPPVFVATGADGTLSPDGKWVLVSQFTHRDELTLVPTGPGMPRVVAQGGLATRATADWFPDGKHIVFAGGEAGRPLRIYVRDLESGAERAISGENVTLTFFNPVSADGAWVLGVDAAGEALRYPVAGGDPQPIKGLVRGDVVLGFTGDGKAVHVRAGSDLPCAILRIDLATGKRVPVRELRPEVASDGLHQLRFLALTPSAQGYAYDLLTTSSDLYLVSGFDQ